MKKNNRLVIKNLLTVLIAITALFAVARAQEKTFVVVPTPMPMSQKLSPEITAALISCPASLLSGRRGRAFQTKAESEFQSNSAAKIIGFSLIPARTRRLFTASRINL